jgi:nucleoside-diphosphate-sugar epimerase
VKVAVTGADGQLGGAVVHALVNQGDEVYSLTHAEIELPGVESVRNRLSSTSADL